MKKITKRVKALCATSIMMVASLLGGIFALGNTAKVNATSLDVTLSKGQSAYVEMYSPDNASGYAGYATTYSPNSVNVGDHLSSAITTNTKTDSGKGLLIDYKAGNAVGVHLRMEMSVSAESVVQNVQGIAFWVEIPKTIDTYSFSLGVVVNDATAEKSGAWSTINSGSKLTLIDTSSGVGFINEQISGWKHCRFNGHTGWVMVPVSAFSGAVTPVAGQNYDVYFQFVGTNDSNSRTADMQMTIGSFGYYTDYDSFVAEKVGESYTQLYNPATATSLPSSTDTNYVERSFVDYANSPTGKALKISYLDTAHTSAPYAIVKLPTPEVMPAGLAMWIDLSENKDEYAFSLMLDNGPTWAGAGGTELTLISTDGTITTLTTKSKKQYLGSFKGWVMIPASTFTSTDPTNATRYNIMYQFETASHANTMNLYVGEIGYYTNANAFIHEKCSQKNYIEGYTPTTAINSTDKAHLTTSVQENVASPTGKVLALDYKVGNTTATDLEIALSEPANGTTVSGLAMWIDVPKTDEAYSFSLIIRNRNEYKNPYGDVGGTLTLLSADGTVETQKCPWKYMNFDGFSGWVIFSDLAIPNIQPDGVNPYILTIQFAGTNGTPHRTKNLQMSIGSIGWFTDINAFLSQMKMMNYVSEKIQTYLNKANALEVKTEEQEVIQNAMFSYYTGLSQKYMSLDSVGQKSVFCNLQSYFDKNVEEFLHGDIRQGEMIMSFALVSDPHNNRNSEGTPYVQTKMEEALNDAKKLDANLAGAFILGDLSDVGVASREEDKAKTDLNVYYDWQKKYQATYTNADSNEIPIVSILGNHDIRGPIIQNYYQGGGAGYDIAGAYPLAVEMYLEEEPLAKKANSIQFDTWINGYHFIFLNTEFVERDVMPNPSNPTVTHTTSKDDCILSWQTIDWLDETLSEGEDGKPTFIFVHQPKGKVYAEKGSAMTFEQVIAKHPSSVVVSGHEHMAFGSEGQAQWFADEGEGVYFTVPAIQGVPQYYFVEVYENAVIFRAREFSTDSWLVENDIVVRNANTSIAGDTLTSLSKELGKIYYTDEELTDSGWDGVSQDANKLSLYETAFSKSNIKYYIASADLSGQTVSTYDQREFYKVVGTQDGWRYKYTHVNKTFFACDNAAEASLPIRRIGRDGRFGVYNRGIDGGTSTFNFDYVHSFGFIAPTDGNLTIPKHTLIITGIDANSKAFHMGWSVGDENRATMSPTDSSLNWVEYDATGRYTIEEQTFHLHKGEVVYLNMYTELVENGYDARVEIKYDPTFDFVSANCHTTEVGKVHMTDAEIKASGLTMTNGILGIDASPATTELTTEQLAAKELAYRTAFEKSALKYYAAIADSAISTGEGVAYLQKEYWQWAVDTNNSWRFNYTEINGLSAGHHGIDKTYAIEGELDNTDRFSSDASGQHVVYTDEGTFKEDGTFNNNAREYVWSFGWTAPADGILVIPEHTLTIVGGGDKVSGGYLLLGYSHDAVADGLRTTISPEDSTHGWVEYRERNKTYTIPKRAFQVKAGDMVYINMCAKIHSIWIEDYKPSFEFHEDNRGIITSASISTASQIGMNFYVAMQKGTERVIAEMQMEGREAIVVEGVYDASKGLWKFTYPTVAQDYDKKVDIRIIAVDDESTDMPVSLVDGVAYIEVGGKTVRLANSSTYGTLSTADYSVKRYTDAIAAADLSATITQELKTLAANLATYCEAAKVHFNTPNTATKVDEDVITSEALKDYKVQISGEGEDVKPLGASLVLLSETTIHVYFNAPNDQTAVSVEGREYTSEWTSGKTFTTELVPGKTDWYVVKIPLSAKELSDKQTVTIGGYTVVYGAYSYIVSKLNTADPALYNVLQALYDYSVAANAYFATLQGGNL